MTSVVSNQIFIAITDAVYKMKVVTTPYFAQYNVSFLKGCVISYRFTDYRLPRLEQWKHGIADTCYLACFPIQQMIARFLIFVPTIGEISHLMVKITIKLVFFIKKKSLENVRDLQCHYGSWNSIAHIDFYKPIGTMHKKLAKSL